MAITVTDLSSNVANTYAEQTGVTAGNEYIWLVPKNAKVLIQGNKTSGSADADLKSSIAGHGDITSDGDFSKFALVENITDDTFQKVTEDYGITAVGLDITSGTWDIRVRILK